MATELRSLPQPIALDKAHHRVALAAILATAALDESERAREQVERAETVRTTRADELTTDANLLGLPADAAALTALSAAILRYEQLVADFWHATELAIQGTRILREASARLNQHRARAMTAQVEQGEAITDFESRSAAAAALLARVGDDVAQYRARVVAVKTALDEIKLGLKKTRDLNVEAGKREAILGEKLREAREKQEGVARSRVTSVALLRKTAQLGLVRVALPDIDQPDPDAEWSVTQGVQVARSIDHALAELDGSDTRFERVQTQVHAEFTALQQSLSRHGHSAESYPRDEGYQVLVVFAGRQVSLIELAESLSSDIEARERLLGVREREIIENHLVTEVGTHLSELVGEADQQIADVNSELSRRPTSTGMKLRVRWKQRADGPAGLAQARARLTKIADAWDEVDREELGMFLQARIAEVRESDESGNWYEHLGDALDYRRWHHFVVERYQGGAWKSATGPASGGERVLAASIPLFAAASSHYRTAGNPYAPRLVMLDEAFAGVDDNSRASCLGLLAAFDLDVVMTSEREWGCYAEVPGLSIAQLSRFDDTPAVLVQLWSWDGHQKTRAAAASPGELVATDTMW